MEPQSSGLLPKFFFALVTLFLLVPMMIIVPLSFSTADFLQFPPHDLGLRWYAVYFNDPVWIDATLRSVRVGVSASLISTIAGTAAAVWISRRHGSLRSFVATLFLVPSIIPNIIIALGVFMLAIQLSATGSEIVLALAHAMLGLPFVTLIVGGAIAQVNIAPEQAARIFGAGPLRAFFATTFRALLAPICSAAIFAFFVSFDELVIALFTSGTNITLPVRIWSDLRYEINPTLAAVASMLIALNTVFLLLAEFLRRRSQ